MHPGGSVPCARKLARAWHRSLLVLAILITAAASGCGGSGQHPLGPATKTRATACGTATTAAAVPVRVEIVRGHLTCDEARTVAHDYANAIRSGKAPGNGGGGPVKVNGWTCQGFPTPVVLRTGKTSKCVRPGLEILEILPPPSPSSS